MGRSLSLRGADSLEQQKYEDAESLFVEALRRSPNDERAQWGYAEVMWQRGQHAAAIQQMSKAVELSGANPAWLVRLGQMYLEEGDLVHAKEKADLALRSRRDDPTAWALKADVHRHSGELEDAICCYQRAMVYRPDWPEVQVTVAELYCKLKRPQRALATLDRMSDQRSETQQPPRSYLVRSQALADMGEHEAAMMCLRTASGRIAPDQSEILFQFAQQQMQLGDLVEARVCLGRVLQREPNHSGAQHLQMELDRQFSGGVGPKIPAMMANVPVPPRDLR